MNNSFENEPQFTENNEPQQRYVTYVPYGLTPETFEERRNIKKVANTIGAALLIVLAASEVIVFVLRFILNIFNLWNTKTLAFTSDPAFNEIFNTVFSTVMFTLPFIICFKISGVRVSGLIRFRLPAKKDILPYLFLGIAFCAIANITVSYMGSIFSMFGINYDVDYGENPQGILGFMLTFISTAIIPPLVEEFACRGIMLGSLKKYGNSFAVLTSAIVFGIMHGNFQQMPFAFLVGLILGFVTVKTGSIWPAVAIHAFNNAFSVLHDYIFANSAQLTKSIGYLVFLIISLILGLVGVYMLSGRKDAYSIKGKEAKAEKSKLYTWFFTSPTIIIFIVICVLKSFQFFI